MRYTKCELKKGGYILFDAIIEIGKKLEKVNTIKSRNMTEKLLSNFNQYDVDEMTRMLNHYQRFLVKCVNTEEVLDVNYMVEHDLRNLEQMIMETNL